MARIAKSMGRAAEYTAKAPVFLTGEVKEAGGGALRVQAGGLNLSAGDLYISAQLRYDWTADDGSPQLLRKGDRVALLSTDGQMYDLVARMVRV